MNISYDYYKTFYYVAKFKSFTLAANVLFAGQPNVTRTVKTLEEQLGCTLFFRSKRRVELTPEGEKLFRHVQIALEHLHMGEEELLQEKNLLGGVVSVGASETALYGLLLPVLKRFRSKHGEMKLKIGNYTTKQAIAALLEGLADFAVVTAPLEKSNKLTVEELLPFQEVAVCGNAFSSVTKEPVSLPTLAKYPMVGLARSTMTYEYYEKLFSAHGVLYRPDVEVATADQILPMIENDLGIGFVPEFFLKNKKRVHPVPLAEPLPARSICLVKRTDMPLSLAARELEREIKSLYPAKSF